MRFEFEWQEAPGVADKVLAATWSRLSLNVDGLCASEAIDFRSNSRRSGIYGSLFPLAEWLVEQWWQLLHEPSPRSPVPGGRAAPRFLRSWVQRHNLLAARDGGALPDLTISRDGDDICLHWEADPTARSPSRIRFVGQGSVRVPAADFEQTLGDFVDAILARLDERASGNEDVERLLNAWNEIRSADDPERMLCESLAVMGVDPYDPGEATDVLVESVERCIRDLPPKLRADLLEGSDAESFIANLNWVETERASLGGAITDPGFPTVALATASSAHETGYLAARQVRSKLLGISSDDPVPDLTSALVDHLGWARGCTRKVASGAEQLQGMVGLDAASSAPLLLIGDERGLRAERFRLARAAFFPVTSSLGGNARLITSCVTRPQRAARAFAAELLAPAAALEKRVSGRIHDRDVEQLADEFEVSALVISHQVENHGLGYVGT